MAIAVVIVFGSIYFIYIDEFAPGLIKNDGGENNKVNNLEEKPSFEAVFAIAGLLAIAYLILRQRE